MATNDYSQYPPPDPVPSLSITPWIPSGAIAQLVVTIVFEFVALVCVALRIYSRMVKGGKFYFNDYAIFWAMLWASVLVFDNTATVLQGGTGHPAELIKALAPERMPTLAKLFLVGQFAWALANTGVKLSMVDLYIKIFGGSKRFRQTSYVLMGFTLAYCLVVVLNAFLICLPLAYNWNPTAYPNAKCGNKRASFLASGIINLILDLCVICLPMPTLWRLRMKLSLKINLSFMFSVGFLICGISIWRMVIIQTLDFGQSYRRGGELGITTSLEPLLGIANACLPVLQPVASSLAKPISNIRSYISRIVGSSRSTLGRGQSEWADGDSAHARDDLESRNFQRLYGHLYPMSSTHESQVPPANITKTGQQYKATENEIALRELEPRSEHRSEMSD